MEAVNPSSTGQDLLGDLDEIVVLNTAKVGQRLGNYCIDWIGCYFLSYIIEEAGLFLMNNMPTESEGFFYWLFRYLLIFSGGIVYYTFLEAFNRGRTIGKLITGTYAVGNDGQPLTLKQAFLRSLCRLVPFEVFSGLGSAPWHDKWTNTTVVKK